MALRRGAYLKRGANYTEAATLLRCVRPDQSSATVRCHYLQVGGLRACPRACGWAVVEEGGGGAE